VYVATLADNVTLFYIFVSSGDTLAAAADDDYDDWKNMNNIYHTLS